MWCALMLLCCYLGMPRDPSPGIELPEQMNRPPVSAIGTRPANGEVYIEFLPHRFLKLTFV